MARVLTALGGDATLLAYLGGVNGTRIHRALESGGGGSGKPLREMGGVQRT